MVFLSRSLAGMLLVVMVVLSIPLSAHATVPPSLPYGGPVLFMFPCTCSSGATFVMVHDYVRKAPLRLVHVLGISKLFLNFTIRPLGYLTGSYLPLYEAPLCRMLAPGGCFNLNTEGLMDSLPGTGTSL